MKRKAMEVDDYVLPLLKKKKRAWHQHLKLFAQPEGEVVNSMIY